MSSELAPETPVYKGRALSGAEMYILDEYRCLEAERHGRPFVLVIDHSGRCVRVMEARVRRTAAVPAVGSS